MVTGLLIAVLVFEVVRLVLYIRDSRQAKEINRLVREQQERALEFATSQDADWKKLRRLEIKELKQLAKESDIMKWIKVNGISESEK